MMTIVWIIVGFAAVFGIIAFIGSDKGSPKDRASEAAGAAAGGAMFGVSCLLQLIIPAIMLLIGLWLISKIFGN
jgi:uncharacterized membrane protein YuzA (DUF378 family)